MFSAPPLPTAVASPAAVAVPPRAASALLPPPSPPPPRTGSPSAKTPTSPKSAGAAPAGAVLAPLSDETAGRTMMFSAAATLKTQPPSRTPAGTVKPLSKPTDVAGATLVFGAGPAAAPQPKPKPEAGAGASATILFGMPHSSLARPEAPAPPPAMPSPVALDDSPQLPDETLAGPVGGETDATPEASGPSEDGEAPAEEEAARAPEPAEQAPAWHGPPRALVVAVAAALGVVLLLGGVVLAVKKLGHRAPPQAALDALADASVAGEKDTLASPAEAEAQTNAALQLAPKTHFPQAWAQLAEVEIAWSDALNDQSWYWSEQANRAYGAGEDKKKADSEAKATALQDAAKARLKTAFEAAATGNKLDPKSPDVALALADYYRAAHSRLNLSRELKRAALLKADEARIAFVQGAELLSQDEGGAKALEKLKTALSGSPRSARIRFRMAMAYLSMRQDAEAKKELLATLELSPQHERARMAMELLAPAASPEKAATPEGKRE